MFLYFKNSVLASVISIFGCGIASMGIMMLFDGMIVEGIVMIAAGVPFYFIGRSISRKKAYKKWWQELEKKGVIAEAMTSQATAMAIYRKEPCKWTLEAIRKINPMAAAAIEGNAAPQSAAQAAPQPRPAPQPAPQPRPAPQPAPQPRPAPQPAPQPRPAPQPTPQPRSAPQPAAQTPKDILLDVIRVSNENTERHPHIYLQCAQRLEALYAKDPDMYGLKENLSQLHANYAANIRDLTFDNRKKAVECSLRALQLHPDAPAGELDTRVMWLYIHALMASIDAGNSSGTRQQRLQARDMLIATSAHYISSPDERGKKLMGIALPVARCRIAYKLALDLSANEPVQLQKAAAMAQEAMRFCPMDQMRQCDLNPFTADNTVVILTRQQIRELHDRLTYRH